MLAAVRLGGADRAAESRVILDSLAVLVREGHLGKKAAVKDRRAWGPPPA